MLKVRQFSKNDWQRFEIQPAQLHEINFCQAIPSSAISLVDDNGEIMAVLGDCEVYKGRGVAIAFISANAGRHMTTIVRLIKRMIDVGMAKFGYERLEMSVLNGFLPGERMAEMLGFECEGLMRKYFKGKDYKLYAKTKTSGDK